MDPKGKKSRCLVLSTFSTLLLTHSGGDIRPSASAKVLSGYSVILLFSFLPLYPITQYPSNPDQASSPISIQQSIMAPQEHDAALSQRWTILPAYSLSAFFFTYHYQKLTSSEHRYPGTYLGGSSYATSNGVRSVSGGTSFQQSNVVGIGAHVQQTSTSNTGQGPPPPYSNQSANGYRGPTCPYHGPIIHMIPNHSQKSDGQSPMNRFLAEGPSEQSALHVRADTGQLTTSRGCTCYREMEGGGRK